MAVEPQSPFHRGELEIQTRLGVRDRIDRVGRKVIRDYLPDQHRQFYATLPMLFVGSNDDSARPWASVLAGRPGFVSSPDPRTLAVAAKPLFGDPLGTNLRLHAPIGVLGIEYSSRRRNRANGTVTAHGSEGFEIAVGHSFGNCPQYIQARDYELLPGIDHVGQQLPTRRIRDFDDRCRRIISSADNFYIATAVTSTDGNPAHGADVSHRGGKPGFVRIDGGHTLTVPDYVGNFHFNTLGNIAIHPRAGLLFIDFQTGDVLSLTGAAEIIWDSEERRAFAGAERLVKFSLDEGVLVQGAIPIHWNPPAWSPYLDATGSWSDVAEILGANRPAADYRDYRVVRIDEESEVISSFYLEPDDEGPILPHRAGQFLPIELQLPGFSSPFHRSYTISSAAGSPYYRLSIKREEPRSPELAPGIVSNFFHDRIKAGSRIRALPPRGKFTLNEPGTRGIALLSAGVGITPMISMLQQLVQQETGAGEKRQVWFIHGAANGSSQAFGREVRGTAARHPWLNVHIRYSRPRIKDIELRDYDSIGRVDMDLINELLPTDEFEFYLCGPGPFIDSLYSGLKDAGVCDQRIHYEFFATRSALASQTLPNANAIASDLADSKPVRVHFEKSAVSAVWDSTKGSLLDLAEANGLRPPYSCRSGICQSCLTPVLAGNVAYLEAPMSSPESGQVLLCCAYPQSQAAGDELVLDV